jgi:hypothetical protein
MSTLCHNKDDSCLYRHHYENLKYHWKAKNATSISSSVQKITSYSKFFRSFKINLFANKQKQKQMNMLCFLMFFSEQPYITACIRNIQGTKLNLSFIKCYFTLSGGSICCYTQMLKIIVCWKVISCCVVHKLLHNIGTLSNKQHHITHAVWKLPNYTNTTIYNLRGNEHTEWLFRWFSDCANVVQG